MITFTDKGAEKVQEFLDSQSADIQTSGLRVGVRGGGCSGFQYALAFDTQRDGDRSSRTTACASSSTRRACPTSGARSSTTSRASRAPASRSTTRTSSRPAAAAPPSASRRRKRSPPSRRGRTDPRKSLRHRGRRARAGPFCVRGEGRARQAAGPADPDPDADRHGHGGAGSGADPRAAVEVAGDARQAHRRRHQRAAIRTSSRPAGPSPSRSRAGATRSGRCTRRCTGSSSTGPRSSRAPAPPPTSTAERRLRARQGAVRRLPRGPRPAQGARRPPVPGRGLGGVRRDHRHAGVGGPPALGLRALQDRPHQPDAAHGRAARLPAARPRTS